jgi:aromatic-L-amino-acid/L-tryptophan decarboxylase
LTNEIRELEKIARLLEPDAISRQQLLDHVTEYARRYLDAVAHSPAYATRSDNRRALLDAPIAEEGIAIDKALTLLEENVDTRGVNTTSGRYLGYIPAGGLFHSVLGDYLAAITNRYAGLFLAALARCELKIWCCVGWRVKSAIPAVRPET